MTVESIKLERPRVDILLATYNGERFLTEQLDSILNQTYQNWRIIVSDDGSTDSTDRILCSYAERDQRITLCSSSAPQKSACGNFMNLLSKSTAEYFMFCDQDDVWTEDKIADSLNLMRQTENRFGSETPVLVYSDTMVVSSNLELIHPSYLRYSGKAKSGDMLRRLLMTNVVPGCTVLGNSALRKLGIKDRNKIEISRILMHDWWLALIASSCGKIRKLSKPTVLYRQHEANVVGAEKISFRSVESRLVNAANKFWSCVDQAEYLLTLFKEDMSSESVSLVETFVSLSTLPSLRRIAVAYRNGLLKQNKVKALIEMIVLLTTSPKS